MCRECRERFPRRRFQRKLLVSDPGIHHGPCVTHVPWCMSGSLTCVDGKTFPAFPAHAHPRFCISGKRPIMQPRRLWVNISHASAIGYNYNNNETRHFDGIHCTYVKIACDGFKTPWKLLDVTDKTGPINVFGIWTICRSFHSNFDNTVVTYTYMYSRCILTNIWI